jgi:VWFA-related protein
MKVAAFAALAMLVSGSVAGQSAVNQDAPRFRSGVELTPIDVTVVDGQGRPVIGLMPADFKVVIDGAPRRVISAEWISLTSQPGAEAAVVEGYSSNEQATGGRLIVIAIDQANIRFGGGRALAGTIDRFLDKLSGSDRVALVAFGSGTPSVPFTADRSRIKQVVARMNGQMESPQLKSAHSISLSSAAQITRDPGALDRIVDEDCPPDTPQSARARELCKTEIVEEASEILLAAERPRDATIKALTDVLTSLKSIDAPKSLLLISEGLAMFDGDGDTSSQLTALGSLAATARTTIYALRLGDQLFNTTGGTRSASPLDDARFRADGLQTLTSVARGALFTVTGTGEAAFDRIESELSGYYLLGVELGTGLPGGKPSALRVDVSRSGVTIRTRKTISAPVAGREAVDRSPLSAAVAALTSPLTLSALSLRVISFNFQGSDSSRIQLLIHAQIGQTYTAPQSVAVAYMITDATGRVLESQAVTQQMAPAGAGVPSPLAFSAGAALPPGDYSLKLVAAEGDKVGSVETPLHVALVDAGALTLSDLTVGGPLLSGREPISPTVDYTIRFGVVHGYVEAYGPAALTATVRYEIARDAQSPALLTEVVPARSVNQSRAIFSKRLSTGSLPPGRYQLRAVVITGDTPAATLSRAFVIAEPGVLTATSSTSRADVVLGSGTELFLPIEPGDLARPFQPADALRIEILEPFVSRVPAEAKTAFDEGLASFRKRDYVAAEKSFKRAIRPNQDFTAAVAYLAASFAASGHDVEAAGAWQTALVGGSDLPQIYLWLGHALLRTHDLSSARTILEQAAHRWPTDTRFARPLAVVNATTGRGSEAIDLLQQYLAANHDDVDALYLGVLWVYHIRLSGSVLRDRAADLKLAQTYAGEYRRANGPKQLLVTQWLDYLEKSDR